MQKFGVQTKEGGEAGYTLHLLGGGGGGGQE